VTAKIQGRSLQVFMSLQTFFVPAKKDLDFEAARAYYWFMKNTDRRLDRTREANGQYAVETVTVDRPCNKAGQYVAARKRNAAGQYVPAAPVQVDRPRCGYCGKYVFHANHSHRAPQAVAA